MNPYVEPILSSLKLGFSIALLAIVCFAIGLLVNNGHKWLKEIDRKLGEAVDFTGLFPEPKE